MTRSMYNNVKMWSHIFLGSESRQNGPPTDSIGLYYRRYRFTDTFSENDPDDPLGVSTVAIPLAKPISAELMNYDNMNWM